jgi:hypothetical protein
MPVLVVERKYSLSVANPDTRLLVVSGVNLAL